MSTTYHYDDDEEDERVNGSVLTTTTTTNEENEYNDHIGGSSDPTAEINMSSNNITSSDALLPQFTWRAVIAGVTVGGLMCFSNMYFGLQLIEKKLTLKFNHFENVLLQTIAVATATMPLAGGFVGIIPALQMLNEQEAAAAGKPVETPSYLSWWGLTLWSFSLAFLVKQTILVEKLKFPSGTATAQMIKVLHKLNNNQVNHEMFENSSSPNQQQDENLLLDSIDKDPLDSIDNSQELLNDIDMTTDSFQVESMTNESNKEWSKKWKILFISFGVSSFYTFLSYWVPAVKNVPIFGMYLANTWSWSLTPSLSYVGQGMIMGPKTGVSMMIGTVLGWAILGPIAHSKGWAPGKVLDWKHGVKGWLLWISLFVMLAESIVSLLVLLVQMIRARMGLRPVIDSRDPAKESQRVPRNWWVIGLVISSALCIIIVSPLFGVKFYEVLVAVVLALLTSILAVRALGQTDMNPVSGIGKISQIVFAGVAPHNVLANLVAGAVAEAGAQQAGDLMQDLKTGHLLKASPRVQFFGQLIGSFFSVFFAVGAYKLYSTAYTIPSPDMPAPTASIWLDMALLVNGGSLADHVLPFCIVSALLVSLIPILEAINPKLEHYLPSGIALAIGMYVTPNWTIARCLGSLAQWLWHRFFPVTEGEYMIIVASGFVLGEGITSIITALLSAF
ncbi:hypothetical protein DFA_07476 [Cavenderia fasciculata]|uniref:Oligopeptide transporter n=1 Tax=Cavenderia fasciculata TaxID=261658 RepID=F4PWI8_CACFS|nr:uncharacterized protein DFA_07476 [Cavenderia fasciculata]EGG20352.1 hypothetical protein DFA_07476 [Cavenderia fasciculata]|eukprot:XP_004367335.1 hypothetical protein DFA_07476 [Cavenderia fasciculata]